MGAHGTRKPADNCTVEVPQNTAGPDLLLISRHDESRHPARAGPLCEEFSVCVEHLDPLIFAVGHVDAALPVDHEIVRKLELPGPFTARAPLQEEFSLAREFEHARAAVSICDV